MFAVEVETFFCAAHALRLPGGGAVGLEPAHGHNFQVTVRIACDRLDALETVVDFHVVEEILAAIVGPWKNRDLNAIEPFKSAVNPSAERIAEHIGRAVQSALAAMPDAAARGLRLIHARITEAPFCSALWMA